VQQHGGRAAELVWVIAMPFDIRHLQVQLEQLVSEHSLAIVIAGLIAVCDDKCVFDRKNAAAWDAAAKSLANVGASLDV
jgi:hypothetical protein